MEKAPLIRIKNFLKECINMVNLLTLMLKKSDQRYRANDAAIQPIGLPTPSSAVVERTFFLHHFRKVRQSF